MINKFITKYKAWRDYKNFYRIWYKKNTHNSIYPIHPFPIECVSIGKKSYGDLKIMVWDHKKERINIGNYVSIASNVTFLLGGNHHINTVMNYPMCKISSSGLRSYSKGKIEIEDDVWLGHGCTILSGVTVGKGAVIGSGAVVSKDIPPYAIAVGNPAQIIKYRFDKETIAKLLEIDFGNLSESFIKENIDLFNQPLSSNSLNNILTKIK